VYCGWYEKKVSPQDDKWPIGLHTDRNNEQISQAETSKMINLIDGDD